MICKTSQNFKKFDILRDISVVFASHLASVDVFNPLLNFRSN